MPDLSGDSFATVKVKLVLLQISGLSLCILRTVSFATVKVKLPSNTIVD
jgi:hypothetical protein